MPTIQLNGCSWPAGTGGSGEPGPAGADGADGAPGSRIYVGAGAPEEPAAADDIYIDAETGDLWTFV